MVLSLFTCSKLSFYTLGVLLGFDSVTNFGLAFIFGKCPASVRSVMADTQFRDFREKNLLHLYFSRF